MKIASRKNEKPSSANASPKTPPNVAMKFGHSSPSSNERIVPVTTPTANSATITRVQRRASVRCSGSPLRSHSHSTNTTSAGNATPKQTSGMWTANDSACICRASDR